MSVDLGSRAGRLEDTVTPLGALPRWVLAVPFVPVAFTVAVYTAGYVATRGQDPGFPPQAEFLFMGIAWFVLLVGAFGLWNRATWRAAVPLRRPSATEVVSAIVVAAVAVTVVSPAVNAIAGAFGFPPREPPAVETTVGLVIVVFGTVVAAPVGEEVFFRGLAFGYLLDRGLGLAAAAVGSLVMFAFIHPGVAGVLTALAIGALLTGLRIWFNNLVGAWLAHALVNAAVLVASLSSLPPL